MKTFTLRNMITSLASASLGFALAGTFQMSASAAEINPVFKRKPPVVASAQLQRVSEARFGEINSALFVKFRPNKLLGTAVNIRLDDQREGQEIRLNDEGIAPDREKGDGVFSAELSFDFDAFAKEQERRQELARKVETTPLFKVRQLVDKRTIRFINPVVKVGQFIDLLGFLGIAAVVDPARELLITSTSVVNDPGRTFDVCTGVGNPNGVWTFGHLMTQMANTPMTGIDPSDFTRRWLQRWQINQNINGFAVPARPNIANLVINSWPLLPNGKLNLAQAPFRLLAIVNRVDLRENTIYGGGSAGEARLVFGVINRNNCGSTPQFTVIFEYGIKKANCFELRDWAQQWHDLSSLVLGSPAYNAALQAITTQFTSANADPSKLPNKSALNQLRTNENALNPLWELREFMLSSAGFDAGQLREVTTKQTPQTVLNNTNVIRNFINANQAALLAETHLVPNQFPAGTPFLSGSSFNPAFMAGSPAPGPANFFWRGPAVINSNEARHKLSLNTCNGCHGGETHTNVFTHIMPRPAAAPAGLSGFMTGINLNDPVSGVPRSFDELDRRAQDLDTLVNSSCLIIGLPHLPLLATH